MMSVSAISPPGSPGVEVRPHLGEILIASRLISVSDLDDLLDLQRERGDVRLASLAAEEGAVASTDLLFALSQQYGFPGLDLRQVVIPRQALELVPEDVAHEFLFVPVLLDDRRISIAMADPLAHRVAEIAYAVGLEVTPYVALHEVIKRTLKGAYRSVERQKPFFVGERVERKRLASLLPWAGVEKAESKVEKNEAQALANSAARRDAQEARDRALKAHERGDLQLALEYLGDAIRRVPDSLSLHLRLGLLLGQMGETERAIEVLQKALSLDPNHYKALKNLAILYEELELNTKAVQMWERAAACAPSDTMCRQIHARLDQLLLKEEQV